MSGAKRRFSAEEDREGGNQKRPKAAAVQVRKVECSFPTMHTNAVFKEPMDNRAPSDVAGAPFAQVKTEEDSEGAALS